MAKINILDKHTAQLIAAGEVVERPSSVVKELCENSIDSGATHITVLIEKGGIQKIEIRDNGCGIEPEYMKNAFISHATSKITNETDLDSISTLGFRGEALSSISSIANVALLSKTEDNEFAYEFVIKGGEDVSFCESARPQGTTITVTEIFYNTPARMKFLKKDASEGTYISDIVLKLALSHPEVSFKLIKDNKEQFFSPGDGKLLSAICAVLSRDFGKDLLQVDYTENDVSVKGYITPSRAARASRSMQYFFINGRYVKTRIAMAALENAYRGILMNGRFPGCVLYITMPFNKVDVNVHPAKTEVRFARDGDVFDAVYRGAKSILLKPKSMEKQFEFTAEKHNIDKISEKPVEITVKSNDFTHENASVKHDIPVISVLNNENIIVERKIIPQPAVINTFNNGYGFDHNPDIFCSGTPVEKPSIQPIPEIIQTTLSNPNTETNEENTQPVKLEYIGEVFKTYIVTQRGDEICFIDKHAAHERIIYEKLEANYGNVPCQQLLAPIDLILSAEEKNTVIENIDYLFNFGFEIDDFGGNSVLIRAIPTEIATQDIGNLVLELAQKLLQNAKKPILDKTQWMLSSIACRSAIKAGDKSYDSELLHIARQIIDGDIPAFCPHGRPIVLKLTKKELEKQFGRLG